MKTSTILRSTGLSSIGLAQTRSSLFSVCLLFAFTASGCEQQATTSSVSDPETPESTEQSAAPVTAAELAGMVDDSAAESQQTPQQMAQQMAQTAQSEDSEPQSEVPAGHAGGLGPGRGMGMGMGMGMGAMAGMRGDMTTLHAMFAARDRINRTVKNLPNGAEATTESDDETIAGLIQEHVPAMDERVVQNNPLPPMTFHPVFVELIKHSADYQLSYEDTQKGIKVTYTSEDPFVVMLVQEHARLVSRFIKNGMEEIHKPYTLPQPAQTNEETAPADELSGIKASGVWQTLPDVADSPADNPSTAAKIELGKKLFFDPRISLTGTVSCNTCHNVMEGGDDGRPTSMGIRGLVGTRNAPTVWNSAFQASQFWDGRSPSLEDQARGPIVAGPEMGMPEHKYAIDRIASVPGYQSEFGEVFGDGDVINIENTVKAIAAFERTLITSNSAFDRFILGDQNALTDQQIHGMKLFSSVGCTECHSGAAFNNWKPGDEPQFIDFPRYSKSSYVSKYDFMADVGRSNATKSTADQHYFKVPTLRNINLTAPYFHNGSVATLTESVNVMAETQLDTKLTNSDVADIVAFLNSLEGTFPEIVLPRLPSLSGETLINENEVETVSTSNTTIR